MSGAGDGAGRAPRVRYWDFRRYYAAARERVLARLDGVLASGRLVLGPEVERFERAFAAACGAAHAVGVASGTDALVLALRAVGVSAGDEVVTVANTAVPTAAAIRLAGATPVFAEVEESTFLVDASRLEERITPRTRCLLPVHLFGQGADVATLGALARRRGLALVEDCAQACGATVDGRRVGSFGEVGAFSFYPTKVLGGVGDGGMAVTSRGELAGRLRRLRFYGMGPEGIAEEDGVNSRLDELQAAFLAQRLEGLADEVARRREVAAGYAAGLSGVGDLVLPEPGPGRSHQYYVYTVRTARREGLRRRLAERGVETKVNYPVPLHLMPAFARFGGGPGSLPVTERLAGEVLSLPMHPELTGEEVAIVVDEVRAFFTGGRAG